MPTHTFRNKVFRKTKLNQQRGYFTGNHIHTLKHPVTLIRFFDFRLSLFTGPSCFQYVRRRSLAMLIFSTKYVNEKPNLMRFFQFRFTVKAKRVREIKNVFN